MSAAGNMFTPAHALTPAQVLTHAHTHAQALTPAQALAELANASPGSRVLGRVSNRQPLPLSKRRLRLQRQPSALYLNLTPLIDVVFQLLVFFIATTHFASNENVLRMDLPPRAASTGTSDGSGAAPAPTLADPFAYTEDALRIEVMPGGAIKSRAPVATATNAEDLRMQLERVRRDSGNPAGALPPTFPIVIAPIEHATWQDAVEALNAVAAAGYRNVSFEQKVGEVAATGTTGTATGTTGTTGATTGAVK